MNGEGATVNPHAAAARAECPQVNGRRGAHKFIWLWQAGTMSDKVECSNCGEIRQRTEDGDTILIPGKEGVTNDPVRE